MSLIECPECKSKISDKAINCPSCGLPKPVDYIRNKTGEKDEPLEIDKNSIISQKINEIINDITSTLVKISDDDKQKITQIGSMSFNNFCDSIKYLSSDRKYHSLNDRLDAAVAYKADLNNVINAIKIELKPVSTTKHINIKSKIKSWNTWEKVQYCFISITLPVVGLFVALYCLLSEANKNSFFLIITMSLLGFGLWSIFGALIGIVAATLGMR